LKEANTARLPTAIKPSELTGLKDKGMGVRLQLQAHFTQRDLLVYPGSLQAQMIMRSAPSEEPRRRVYIAANSSTPEQIHILEKLLQTRAELARLVGRESYAEMTLADKMAKSPGQSSPMLSFSPILTYSRQCTLFHRRTNGTYPAVRSESVADAKHTKTNTPWNYFSTYYSSMGS
jgi:intermediate peptidase